MQSVPASVEADSAGEQASLFVKIRMRFSARRLFAAATGPDTIIGGTTDGVDILTMVLLHFQAVLGVR